ncbi:MAG: hypothetical protein VKN17_03410 [Cyanobacteriota bacterium]|nr:hypothetical protein [Cyanobacteriota bacterium]
MTVFQKGGVGLMRGELRRVGGLALLNAAVLGAPLVVIPPAVQAAPAQCIPPKPLSRLSGTWEAQALAHGVGGVARSRQTLELQVDDNGALRGFRDWAVLDRGASGVQGRNRLGQPVSANREPVLGLLDAASCRVLLVETKDAGSLRGWLREREGQPVLELETTQSGQGAVVFFASFRKAVFQP